MRRIDEREDTAFAGFAQVVGTGLEFDARLAGIQCIHQFRHTAHRNIHEHQTRIRIPLVCTHIGGQAEAVHQGVVTVGSVLHRIVGQDHTTIGQSHFLVDETGPPLF